MTLAKFNPKNKTFIRNLLGIFKRLLQRPRVLSVKYCCVPFIQKKREIKLYMKECHIVSIYHKRRGVRNSQTVRNNKTSLYCIIVFLIEIDETCVLIFSLRSMQPKENHTKQNFIQNQNDQE